MDIQMLVDEIPVEGEYALEGVEFIRSGKQYLMFCLGSERYAVDILCVEEIRSWTAPTIIPNAPVFVKGVINMRGVIVPIIDLRIQFGIGEVVYSETTVVIVLTVSNGVQGKTLGFVVDAVSDVLNAEDTELKAAPPFGGSIPQHYIDGLVNVVDGVVTILNVKEIQTLQKHDVH